MLYSTEYRILWWW